MEKSIEDWCNNFDLFKYKITDDGFVDVNYCVDIGLRNLETIPIKFGIVSRFMSCGSNLLESLKGSPVKIYGSFYCHRNKLISLKDSPKIISEDFVCEHNFITSMEGSPLKVDGKFYCESNPIYEEYSKYDNYQHYMRHIKIKQLI
jgi:hypothetical protein